MATGYSGRPLAKKPGIKEGTVVAVDETWSGLRHVVRKELRRK